MQEKEFKNSFVDRLVGELKPMIIKASLLTPEKQKAGVRSPGNAAMNIQGYKAIAEHLFVQAKRQYPDAADWGYRQAKAVVKALYKEIPDSEPDGIKPATPREILTLVNIHMNDLYSPLKQALRADYDERVKNRMQDESEIEIDPSEYLQKAYDILELAATGIVHREGIIWQDVSCALALVTGRRMAEVHCTGHFAEYEGEDAKHTRFVDDDHKLVFSGRLKTGSKSSRESVYVIPCLVPSELAVIGLEWLSDNGKRFPDTEDPMRVNRAYSKYLSENIKRNWYVVPDEIWAAAEGAGGKASMSYHKMRAIYHACCSANYSAAGGKLKFYAETAQNWLADDRDASVLSYERLICKPGAITQL